MDCLTSIVGNFGDFIVFRRESVDQNNITKMGEKN